jgi:hypothetical protein
MRKLLNYIWPFVRRSEYELADGALSRACRWLCDMRKERDAALNRAEAAEERLRLLLSKVYDRVWN